MICNACISPRVCSEFSNPISGEEYNTTWKRPSSGDYESHSSGNGLGTGTDYFITFEGSGPGSYPLGKDADTISVIKKRPA